VTSFKKTKQQSLARITESGRREGERGGGREREEGIPREGGEAQGAPNAVTSISPFSPLKGDMYEGERDGGERDEAAGERDERERDAREREAGAATAIPDTLDTQQSQTRLPSPPRKLRALPTPGLHFYLI
jgi:hypothetical protein